MKTDALVSSDLQALGAATAERIPAVADTARALEAALARREGPPARRLLGKPVLVGALAVGVVALLVPVPYRHRVGWEATFHSGTGRVVTVPLAARDATEAQRRALALARSMGAEVRIRPRTELAWGSVYAMAREKLFRIDVDLSGKTDAEAEAEIRAQLAQQGWTPGNVAVQRGDGTTTVTLNANDDEGHFLRVMQATSGAQGDRVQVEPEPFDDTREPGMTDEQLRERIRAQFRARGLDAEVTVDGGRVQVRVMRPPPSQ